MIPEFLQQRFFAGLERRVTELQTLLDQLATKDADLETLTRGFHSLAGIGGTYGFPQVTEIARNAESFCESLRPPVRDDQLEILRNAVAALERVRLAVAA